MANQYLIQQIYNEVRPKIARSMRQLTNNLSY